MNSQSIRTSFQAGQAMVEMCIIAGVLVLLFFGIWYLGKFHDIQAGTIQVARYAAWERIVRAPDFTDKQLEQQARARLFTWTRDAFKDGDGRANGSGWGTQHAMWTDQAGDALVGRPDDVTVSTAEAKLPGVVGQKTDQIIAAIEKKTAGFTGGEALPVGGFHTSKVQVKLSNLARLPAPFNALDLSLNESSAVVGDAWDANSPEQVAMRTRPLAPASALQKLAFMLEPLAKALSLVEGSFSELQIGKVCPEIVPADRLSDGKVLPAYRGATCY